MEILERGSHRPVRLCVSAVITETQNGKLAHITCYDAAAL